MCLITLATGVAKRYPLVLAANRDELHARPTAPAGWWDDGPRILGGRDLVAGGSWLAMDPAGRLAAVTNLRERGAEQARRSRGRLVRDFLAGSLPARDFAAGAERDGARYGPFNLLLMDSGGLYYASNRAPGTALPAGLHVLGNAPLGSAWPKIEAARRGMAAALEHDNPTEALLELLTLREVDAASSAFDAHARALFLEGAEYGTRSSTVILVSHDGEVFFTERCYDTGGRPCGEARHTFRLQDTG